MKIIWTFTLMMMIPGVVSFIVTGYSGGGVTITCRYDEGYTANAKYFCKGQWSKCTDQIRTNTKNKWVHSGRFSLCDDTSSAVFTVTIRDLSEGDSGTYYCATERFAKIDLSTKVKLEVITETTPSSSTVDSITLTVSVSVVLLLIFTGLVLLTVTLCRRRQSQNADSSSKRSHVTPADNKTVSLSGCNYKEITDTHSQLPTIPSDSSDNIYANV